MANTPVQLVTQPLASTTLAVYVPPAVTVMLGPAALNPPGPTQLTVNGPVPLVMLTVKIAESPAQTSCVAG